MRNQSLTAPVILSGVGKHIKYKKYTLVNKVFAFVFYFSVKNTENLITFLHSFMCLECHLLFSVTAFAKISLFPYRLLLPPGLDYLSLRPTSLVHYFFFHLSLLLFSLLFLDFLSTHLKCFLGTHLSFSKWKDSLGLLLSSSLKGEEIQIIQNRAQASHWHYQQMFLFLISRFCNF